MSFPNKALSIRQPWAWLIVHGIKDVENRNWKTNYRGPLLIHAGQIIDMSAYRYVEENFSDAIKIPPPDLLDTGGIVGITNIVDCLEDPNDYPWHNPGSYGFLLKGSKPLPFIPFKGKLGFFKVAYSGQLCTV